MKAAVTGTIACLLVGVSPAAGGPEVKASGVQEALDAVRARMVRPHPQSERRVVVLPAEIPVPPVGPKPVRPHSGNTRQLVLKLSREEVELLLSGF